MDKEEVKHRLMDDIAKLQALVESFPEGRIQDALRDLIEDMQGDLDKLKDG